MGFDYAKTAATVLRLLARFGAPTTLKVKTGQVYDPATGTTTATETTYPCTACNTQAERSYVDGTLIGDGARVFLVAPQGIPEPKPGMKLVWQGADLAVTICKPLAPAGVPVMYELQVKG
ncbi:hypothetical protein SAMN05216359_105272 [Roseateles sp. YR242]|uniref:hypothetical protein n=1 Tax=Roseateles sp. YR242 TaxID=1855305 RepID=UPI0008C3C199|nr:hypothetical protein [Roseateles sp. YR242]SEL12119.1 hypothetical protein SAMN05216359_105272 [Roseateles sp. YR242]